MGMLYITFVDTSDTRNRNIYTPLCSFGPTTVIDSQRLNHHPSLLNDRNPLHRQRFYHGLRIIDSILVMGFDWIFMHYSYRTDGHEDLEVTRPRLGRLFDVCLNGNSGSIFIIASIRPHTNHTLRVLQLYTGYRLLCCTALTMDDSLRDLLHMILRNSSKSSISAMLSDFWLHSSAGYPFVSTCCGSSAQCSPSGNAHSSFSSHYKSL